MSASGRREGEGNTLVGALDPLLTGVVDRVAEGDGLREDKGRRLLGVPDRIGPSD